uniref:aldolase/citrate lyase family protein n=1 Tax=Sphingomonas bacterium TaxID=1895847 RepID=UPI0020C69D85
VPHIGSAAAAREVVAACRYRGGRGFSTSPRAGDYGRRGMWEHVDAADAATLVIAMIEDLPAVAAIDEILAVEGLDAVFIGRADLMVSLGDRAQGGERTREATERAMAAAVRAGKPACLFVSRPGEIAPAQDLGASMFVLSSDQGLLATAASAAVREART